MLVTINRSAEWVKARRLATGTNVPESISVPVNPRDLSESARAIVLAANGGRYPAEAESVSWDYNTQTYDLATNSNAYHWNDLPIEIDSDEPPLTEIETAILALPGRVQAIRAESEAKKAAAEAERLAKAKEWAALPLNWRADATGPCWCRPLNSPPDYSGPLSFSGVVTYDRDDLKRLVPEAWAEAEAEGKRLAAEEKTKKESEKNVLAAWVREHGSELARLRLEEGYDCWVSVAHDDYADSILTQIAGDLKSADIPDGYDTDEIEPRKCPTAEEIKLLRAIREKIKDSPVEAELQYSIYTPDTETLEDDYEAEPIKRAEVRLTVTCPDGYEVTRDYLAK